MKSLVKEDQFLKFYLVGKKSKTKIFSVISKCDGSELGDIYWYCPWRHYCFFTGIGGIGGFVLSDRCLRSIADFISDINLHHKNKPAE